MSRKEKMDLAIQKGYSCDIKNGFIIGVKGDILKCTSNKDYSSFNIWYQNKQYAILSHIFIWYYFYKEVIDYPKEQIDHINRDKKDNRIENLRKVTNSGNQQNKNSKGYSYLKSHKRWYARIIVNNKRIHLGSYKTENEARQSYIKAKQLYHI